MNAPIDIGLRTKRYGPRTTRRRGGSIGSGVPRPCVANVRTHHSAIPTPTPTIAIPASCRAPHLGGATRPDHVAMRMGTKTMNSERNNIAYVRARASTNIESILEQFHLCARALGAAERLGVAIRSLRRISEAAFGCVEERLDGGAVLAGRLAALAEPIVVELASLGFAHAREDA